MRVLFLTTELPWPLDGGGKLRTFETLTCLASFADVQVLSLAEQADPRFAQQALNNALPAVTIADPIRHQVRIRRKPAALARTVLLQVLHGEPYLVAKFRNRRYIASAHALATSSLPDIIWCDHLNVFPATLAAQAAAGNSAIVLDEHNVETDLFRKGAGIAGVLKVLASFEGRRVARYERRALRRADRVVAICAEDADRLAGLGAGDRVRVCLPSIGPLAEGVHPPDAGASVAFLGSLSWPPNAEAARFLALEVYPRLRDLVPGVSIRIGGRGLDPSSERRIREAGVQMAGYVQDAAAFLRSASVAAVPVLSGSGVSMKLLDSWKAGVPTVTTPVGARGFPVPDDAVCIADDAPSFAEALASLLRDPERRRRLVARAHDYLVANHSREALRSRYQTVATEAIEAAVEARGHGRALSQDQPKQSRAASLRP